MIEVAAVSLEGGDVLRRRLFPPPTPNYVAGIAAAGSIAEVGKGVFGLEIGQRVVAFNWSGAQASLFKAPAEFVFPIPDGLTEIAAAAGLIAFGTAHDALFEFGRLQAGETVLIQGAAGGVGLAAVQLAARAGARVIATASAADRLDAVRVLGASDGINYRYEDIGARALDFTRGEGVDLVVDLAGGDGHRSLIAALRYRGRYAVVGAATGERPSFSSVDISMKCLSVFGVLLGREMHTARLHGNIAELLSDMAAGVLHMPIARSFALADTAAAHRYAEEGRPFGRIILEP